ncbi:hypothetical protein DL769_006386 [Monosporascus sp. CRB-8-3]|nr:hypothetical protein DL769_006386 [Monosporascus sp. CRB-8-3]
MLTSIVYRPKCIEGMPVVQIVQNTRKKLPWCPEAQKKLTRHCVRFRLSRYVGPRYCGTYRFQQILTDLNCDFGSEDESGLFIAFIWPKIRNALEYRLKVLQDIGAIFYDELGREQYAEWANLCLEEDWDGNIKSLAPDPRAEDLDHDAYSDAPVYAHHGAVDDGVRPCAPLRRQPSARGGGMEKSRTAEVSSRPSSRKPAGSEVNSTTNARPPPPMSAVTTHRDGPPRGLAASRHAPSQSSRDKRSVTSRTPSELFLAASEAAANNSHAGHCTSQPTGRRPPQPLNRNPGRRQADSTPATTPDSTPAQTRRRRPDAQGSAGSRPSRRARGGETYEHPAGLYGTEEILRWQGGIRAADRPIEVYQEAVKLRVLIDSYDYYLATHHTEASTSAVPKATMDLRKCNRSDLEETRREAIEELESCYKVLNTGAWGAGLGCADDWWKLESASQLRALSTFIPGPEKAGSIEP